MDASMLRKSLASIQRAAIASVLILCATGVPAVADNAMSITIVNDTTADILVTVYDTSSKPSQKVLSSRKLNGFASVNISIGADAEGRGHVAWTATSMDDDNHTCGRNEVAGLANNDSVHVSAAGSCAPAPAT
jgi:hypothetical protein